MPNSILATAAKSAGSETVRRAIDALPRATTNVGDTERWVSLAVGGALATLGFTGRGPSILSVLAGGALMYRAASGHCSAYQAMGVNTAHRSADNAAIPAGEGTRVEHAVTVNKPAADVYRFWRGFENLPRFMNHLESVKETGNGRSHWVARGPLGMKVEWDAEIVADEAGKVISWKSLDGSDVDTAGSVHFRDLGDGRGTEVRVNLKYDPPGGKVGTAVARLFGEAPDQQVRDDLQRFKELMETGRIPAAGRK